jgi:hypothetical protein
LRGVGASNRETSRITTLEQVGCGDQKETAISCQSRSGAYLVTATLLVIVNDGDGH